MMANKNPLPASVTVNKSSNSSETKNIICDYSDEEYDPTVCHPLVIKPSSRSHSHNQQSKRECNSIFNQHEDSEQRKPTFMLDLNPLIEVPIQRVSSEDELNLYVKSKRAKFIGPYLFGDVIGQGSYAKVKECLDSRNLCRRAVKIMQRRRLRRTPHGEEMAATEIRLLKSLTHPNIIRLYDFIRNDEKEKLYLFIDLCVVSLQDMLDSDEEEHQLKVFPLWQAHGYFVQLIHGLQYLHSKSIIHNDIKPGNLLITVDHQLKITDFGTAEQLDMFSADDTISRSQGTPAFQCPEIANGEDKYSGFSIDIWSCGVTLYNLVTGRLPFEAENIYLLFQTIGKGVYKIPDDIESNLAGLIHGLLHIEVEKRFKIEQIKQHEWFRRRPSRTSEILPFPSEALSRFQTFTMYDYLSDLNQVDEVLPQNLNDEDDDEQMKISDRYITDLDDSHDHQQYEIEQQNYQKEQEPQGQPTLDNDRNRPSADDNPTRSKARSKRETRGCSIS